MEIFFVKFQIFPGYCFSESFKQNQKKWIISQKKGLYYCKNSCRFDVF